MTVRKFLPALLILALATIAAPILRADTLSAALVGSDTVAADAGSSVTFEATVSAPGTNSKPIYLNSDSFVTSSTLVTVDDSPYLANAPLSLNPGDSSLAFDIFTVDLNPTLAPGSYTGTFSILGGSDSDTTDPLANLNFTINVPSSNVPEPATLPMLLLGAALAGAFTLTRKR